VKTVDGLRALAAKIPGSGPPPVGLARQRAVAAVEEVAAAIARDPTVAERCMREIDVLAEILRRLAPFARQVINVLEHQRLTAAGQSTAHLGRVNPDAPEELDAVSQRCAVYAARVTAQVWPDWNTPDRVRELSRLRMPGEDTLATIADSLRATVAASLALPHPDPEAVRLAALAGQIAPAGKEKHEAEGRTGHQQAIAAIITEAVIANATDYGTKVVAVDPETIGYQIIDALREYGLTITRKR
jgi:hypothetical protein